MSAAALEQGRTKRTHGAEPERTCVVSRAVLTPDELIRFVRSPDGVVVPDLAGRLPGRGVWVTCEKSFVAKAAERNAFAKSLKSPVKVPPDLADMVETLLKARALSALSFANKAGQVLCGFTKVEISIAKGEAFALLHGSDAAIDGRNKLDRKYKAVHAEMGAKHPAQIISTFVADELSLAMGRSHVVHAALAKGGAARNFLKEVQRLQRYQTHSSGEAAQPPETGSGTEQA